MIPFAIMSESNSKKHKDIFIRTVAIIGLVAIIILGGWGIIELVSAIPTFLGSAGSNIGTFFGSKAQPEAVAVTVPQFTPTGAAFTISWNHTNYPSGDYGYALSYSCTKGLSLKAPAPNGSYQPVPCNTPFNYTNATTTMQLIPSVIGSSQLSSIFSISAISLADGSVTSTGTSTLTVLPLRERTNGIPAQSVGAYQATTPQSAPTTPTITTTVTRSPYYSNPNGLPDLAVHILSATPEGNGLVSVEFIIQNIGTKVTPFGWTFDASLPVSYTYTYYSRPQSAIYPNEKILYTLSFAQTAQTYPNSNCYVQQNGTYSGSYQTYPYQYQNCYTYSNQEAYGYTGNTLTITVDPSDLIQELSKVNNTASITVPDPYY